MVLVLFEHPRDSAVAPLTFKTSVQNDILPVLLGENKPSVIPRAVQLWKALGADDLAKGSFTPPSTRSIGWHWFVLSLSSGYTWGCKVENAQASG